MGPETRGINQPGNQGSPDDIKKAEGILETQPVQRKHSEERAAKAEYLKKIGAEGARVVKENVIPQYTKKWEELGGTKNDEYIEVLTGQWPDKKVDGKQVPGRTFTLKRFVPKKGGNSTGERLVGAMEAEGRTVELPSQKVREVWEKYLPAADDSDNSTVRYRQNLEAKAERVQVSQTREAREEEEEQERLMADI